ncbi:DUF2914 domain-containing protein [Pendulispora albinea]|uniref:DUF2914 domain-containing protein n=1 Tax=Pendulispora albinea TaxID=2741071 RepID=A0ABZ2LQM7_9BACT
MKLSHFMLMASLGSLLSLSTTATLAHADEESTVTIVSGQFADHVEGGKPVGDAKSIAAAHKAVYFVDAANTGAPAAITLVWLIDGKEVQRQSLDVGHAAHWRTWGTRRIAGAKSVGVQILDASGKSLKEDTLTFDAT